MRQSMSTNQDELVRFTRGNEMLQKERDLFTYAAAFFALVKGLFSSRPTWFLVPVRSMAKVKEAAANGFDVRRWHSYTLNCSYVRDHRLSSHLRLATVITSGVVLKPN